MSHRLWIRDEGLATAVADATSRGDEAGEPNFRVKFALTSPAGRVGDQLYLFRQEAVDARTQDMGTFADYEVESFRLAVSSEAGWTTGSGPHMKSVEFLEDGTLRVTLRNEQVLEAPAGTYRYVLRLDP